MSDRPRTEANGAASAPDFYVGYLPVPARLRTFLGWIVSAALASLVIAAIVAATSQSDPGSAQWDDGQVRSFAGLVSAHPYPMLYADDRGDGVPGVLLLVEIGKRGGGQRAAPFDGRRMRVSGWLLHRDGRQMIEMEPGDAALQPDASAPTKGAMPPPRSLGRVSLKGEIVDSKCYLGAMKPGEGKTHKECATLCITGGIPPMLVTRDAKGVASYYLLTDPAGAALETGARPFVADPVEVSGELESQGGLLRLRTSAKDIRRL